MKGIVLAAGKGRRIRDVALSRILPKPLFPVGGSCIIESPITLLERSGIDDLIVVVNYKADLIKEFLGDGREWGVHIKYVYQPILNGIAGAIADCASEIDRDDFVVCLGDEITMTPNIANMLALFETGKAKIVEGVVHEHTEHTIRETNEVLLSSDGQIFEIVEKPQKPRTLNRGIGIYVCENSVLDVIHRITPSKIRGEKEITDVVADLATKGEAYGAWLEGYTININTNEDYQNAERALFNRYMEVGRC